VREALMRLQEEGLVEIIPRRGPIVRTIAPREMFEILQVREMLEGLASRLAAARMPIARVKELRAEWEDLRATLTEGTLERLHRKGYELHDIIIAAAEDQTLARLLDSIRGRLDSSRQLYLKTLGPLALKRARLSCEEHLRVIAALEKGDEQESEESMREHLRQLRAEILGGRIGAG
jgi:DNA-binding GntR family transcriptional regulator